MNEDAVSGHWNKCSYYYYFFYLDQKKDFSVSYMQK